MEAVLTGNRATDKPKTLLERVRDVIRLKHYSLRTERSYCDWIERFIRFHRRGTRARWGKWRWVSI
jgi:hypothetical protein